MTIRDVSLRRRVAELERRLAETTGELRALAAAPANYQAPRERWLGVVVQYSSSPPSPGDNCYRVQLVSMVYNDGAPGVVAYSTVERGSYVNALSWPARDYQVGAFVVVERIRGTVAASTLSGEWIIASDRAEVRWGRTRSYSYSYPDLSRGGASTYGAAAPVYEVELGRYPGPAALPAQDGFGKYRLTLASKVDPALTRFAADSPPVVVWAFSTIGDLHDNQPVLMVLEGGYWYIVAPYGVGWTFETVSFAGGYLYGGSYGAQRVTGSDRVSLAVQTVLGTGGNAAAPPNERWLDVRHLAQTSFNDPGLEITRRGDYEFSLVAWEPAVYRYGYLTGSYDANEAKTVSDTVTNTDTGGDTVTHYFNYCFWRGLVTIEWVAGPVARVDPIVAQFELTFNYGKKPEVYEARRVSPVNKGDKLRIVIENAPISGFAEDYYPASIAARGWELLAGWLYIRRCGGDGATNTVY